MSTIYLNLHGSLTSGGPTVAAARLAQGFAKKGHKVIYNNPERADIALCIIESGKTLRKINRNKTKIAVRLDGFYMRDYWHDKTPDRRWRDDMTALHKAIKRDIDKVDIMIYQSSFSKRMADIELGERKSKFAIIHNGVNIKRFKPRPYVKDNIIRLFHHGVIRNDYIINGLLGVYDELRKRGNKVSLTIVGSMDKVCSKIYNSYNNDGGIKFLGPVKNSKLQNSFVNGAIGVYNRQGSSNDNCVIESLASGCPVVIPSFGGNAELITSGKHGIVVRSNKWDYGIEYNKRIADAIEKIYDKLDDFVINARKHAVNNLSIDTMIDKYSKVLGI